VEQSLEVDGLVETTNPVRQRMEPGSQREAERREGTDHGDVAQLQSREKLRRVLRHRGRYRRVDSCLQEKVRWAGNMANPMTGCGVQQTRRLLMRSKPSKLGGTAGTEHVRRVAAPDQRSIELYELDQLGVDAQQ
jgi:hypothetical protein